MDKGQHLAAQLVQQQARADIGVIGLLLDQRARGHDRRQRQFVLADAVVEIAGGLGEHGAGGDAVEPGAGLADNQREPRGRRADALCRRRSVTCSAGATAGRRLRGLPAGALARAPRGTAHRRARPCGARSASGRVRPGPGCPRYGRRGPRRPPRQRGDDFCLSCSTISWMRREAAALVPSTARNALVMATAILAGRTARPCRCGG